MTAWVAGRKGGKMRLLLEGGESINKPAEQLMFLWEDEALIEPSKDEARARLAQMSRELTTGAEAFAPEALHRELAGEQQFSFDELAARLLPAEATGWERAALFKSLLGAPLLFRHSAGGFTARAAEEVERLRLKAREESERLQWRELAAEWREALEGGRWPGGGHPWGESFLERLESMLTLEKRSPYWNLLAKPLGLKAARMAEQQTMIKHWLELAGRWSGWPEVWLRGAGVSGDFEPATEEQARRLSGGRPVSRGRRDFRGSPVYTFDSAGSRDLDDAFSLLESGGEGLTVAVHIAEPFQGTLEEEPIFAEAARRISTVYTPGAIFPMLPPMISEGRYSLLAGQERETVSFTFRLTGEGGVLERIERGLIRVEANLDYSRGDELLGSEEGQWRRLDRLCQALAAARAGRGAVVVTERMEVKLNCSDPERIVLHRSDRFGPAQRLVEELAILTNREAGNYCRVNGLPAIYRVQPHPQGGARERGAQKGSQRDNTTVSRQLAAGLSTEGAPHEGLGCDRYVQVTSPLRRFPDLVMQRQIITHAAQGHAAFTRAGQMEEWAIEAEERLAIHSELERRIKNYWKLRYLSQNPGRKYTGTVRRNGGLPLGRVWLEELMLMVDGQLPLHSQVGDSHQFKLAEVDLDRQFAEVAPADF